LVKYFVSDTNDLGYHYSVHGMDDYDKIYTGYVTIDYYLYRWFNIDSTHYGVIFEKNDQDYSIFFLSVFNNDGVMCSKIPLSDESIDEWFSESCMSDKYYIKKVIYSYIGKNKSKILIHNYKYNIENESFELIKKDSLETSYDFYDYRKHNLEDDPLFVPEN
jgi:hypothetical protein